MKILALFALVLSLSTLAAQAGDEDAPTDLRYAELGIGGLVMHTSGDWAALSAQGNAGLVLNFGMVMCAGSRAAGDTESWGLMVRNTELWGPGGYGSTDLGVSLCDLTGDGEAKHLYVSGGETFTRVGNFESHLYGGRLGAALVRVSDRQGLKKLLVDVSVFTGLMKNFYDDASGREYEQKGTFAMGLRVHALYRDLLRRLEFEGQLEGASANVDTSVSSADPSDPSTYTSTFGAQAAARWLAVEIDKSRHMFLYVGIEGDLLYAHDVITDLSRLPKGAEPGAKSQSGAQGLGVVGVGF